MNYTFSKSFLSSYQSDENVVYKQLRLYHVYNDKSMLGEYFRQDKKQFYKFKDQQFKIESKEKWFKKPCYQIVDEQNGNAIGEIILTYPYNDTFSHYPDVPYTDPYLKVVFSNIEYEFRRDRPETEYRLLDSKTWGHYSFGFYDKQNFCVLKYTLKIDSPTLDGSVIFNNTISGNIQSDQDNPLLLFTGFFLLERFLDDQNRSG